MLKQQTEQTAQAICMDGGGVEGAPHHVFSPEGHSRFNAIFIGIFFFFFKKD